MVYSARRHSPTHESAEKGSANPNVVLAVLMAGTFLAPLDSSIVNIALPNIAASFDAQLTAVSWVADAYLLAIATLLLSMGRLGDTWGLRGLYVWGLLVFGAGSLACALAPTLPALVSARVLQAVGAAMLFAAGPAIVARTFPREKRGAALGTITLSVAAGLTAGPALGGVLVGLFGWPSIFYVNIPLALIAAALGWRLLPRLESVTERFDVLGAVLGGGALFLLVGALTEVQAYGLGSPQILSAFAVAVLLGVAFVWWERRTEHPMADLRLFGSKGFSGGLTAALLAYLAMFSVILTMPFYLVRAYGLPETSAGLLLTIPPLAMAGLAPWAGRLSDRIGSRLPSTLGLSVLAVGLGVLSTVGPSTSLWFVGACLFTVGAGMAVFQTPNTAAILAATPHARHGVGSAFIAEARNVGMALGIALTAAIITTQMGSAAAALTVSTALSAADTATFVTGMAVALRTAALFAIVAAAASWFLRGEEAIEVEQLRPGG
jgi:EmrB/QacA subfamily drug resistance transporter